MHLENSHFLVIFSESTSECWYFEHVDEWIQGGVQCTNENSKYVEVLKTIFIYRFTTITTIAVIAVRRVQNQPQECLRVQNHLN